MNHDGHPRGRSQQSGTTLPMYMGSQLRPKRRLPNMHGQHPVPAIGRSILFNKASCLLVGNHVCAGAVQLPWPTEMVFAVDVGLSGLRPGIYENDVIAGLKSFNGLRAFSAYEFNASQVAANDGVIVVDLMLLFTRNIADTFPGDMAQTLMEHLVFKANQTFFDSRINMRLRLVHTQFIDYPNPIMGLTGTFIAYKSVSAGLLIT